MQHSAAESEANRVDARRLAEAINAYQLSAAIGALARLGVADAVAAEPLHPDEIAKRVGADTGALGRLLEATHDLGLFSVDVDGRYGLTRAGELLRADARGSLRRLAIVSTDEWRWRAYGHLTHAVRTGEPGFVPAHGCSFWDYLESHPEAAASFQESMARISALRDAAFVRSYDVGALHRIVDVGGGDGSLLCAWLGAHPDARGLLFDRSNAIEVARKKIAAAELADRCELVAGDFFDSVPEGGDAYVLSWILHDWSDEKAHAILSNCRGAMGETARLLVIELVVPARDEASAADVTRMVRQTDLEMLGVVGGRERTAAELSQLLAQAGFRLDRIVPLVGTPWSVLDAAPT